MLIIIYILLIISVCNQGVNDAVIYSKKGEEALGGKEYIIFIINRSLIILLVWVGFYIHPIELIFLIPAYTLAFSYWYLGIYNITRAKINTPLKSLWSLRSLWMYTSITDIPKVKFEFNARLVQFGFSVSIIIFTLILRHITHNFKF